MITKQAKKSVDLAAIRERLANTKGSQYWRSLDELAETEEFKQFLHNEFPHEVLPDMADPISRRTFLKVMGASLALAGLTACGPLQPEEKIVPHVVPPPEYTPGLPLFFATTMPSGGFGKGVVVMSHEGRPTKIEGNSKHPASLGATDLFTQASILTMYDPDRSQEVLNGGAKSTWEDFLAAVLPLMQGGGVRILTETVTSPTLASLLNSLRESNSSLKWYQYDPVGRDSVREGSTLAFGDYVDAVYNFDKADIVLALDSDFLASGPAVVPYARQFINRRRVREEHSEMNRLYVAESTPSITGAMADHRLPLRSDQIEDLARLVAQGVGIDVGSVNQVAPTAWVEALVEDLQEHRGTSMVIAGESQPAEVHALVHAINHALGNVGETVLLIDPVEAEPVNQLESLKELVSEIQSGQVSVLIIIGGNPAYTAPADLNFGGNLGRVTQSVHLSLYVDETSELCTWHIPAAHYLESWGDIRAYDGTASIIQPLIAPLYGGKSAIDLLASLSGIDAPYAYDLVHAYWMEQTPDLEEKEWELVLQNGVLDGTAFAPRQVSLTATSFSRSAGTGSGLEIVFRPDPTVWDGSFSNNAWLQETPKPLSKITWDNAVHVSPATAYELGLDNEDMVDLSFNGGIVRGPVWITPGHADNSITVHLGYGRTRAGRVGGTADEPVGFNAYVLRSSSAYWFGSGLSVTNTAQKYRLASTQHHHSVEVTNERLQERLAERTMELVKTGTIGQFRENAHFIHEGEHGDLPSVYAPFETASGAPWKGNRWGITIDLNACVACNACVVACQSENNIPTVGREQVIRGREMHWIRIDRYYMGGLDNPQIYHMPVGCMQCENAPCEVVCPVGATSHSLEGLNDMVYNRCVGTRYCANNCPYKVRRYNFLQFTDLESPSLMLMRNPNVTARNRGVMEKCSYCVQRINAARIISKREGTPINDGDISPACEMACPTQAITFGNIADENSRVSSLKREPHNYTLLAELLTYPRTSFLARLRNPNPKIEPPAQSEEPSTQSEEH